VYFYILKFPILGIETRLAASRSAVRSRYAPPFLPYFVFSDFIASELKGNLNPWEK